MQLKTIVFSALAVIGMGHKAQAQNLFDEMQYSAAQTVFYLNSPTSVPTANAAVDGMTGASVQEGAAVPRVILRIYDQGLGGKPVKTVRMKQAGENRWTAVVKGDLKGKFYTFDCGRGETPGVFAKAVGVNGKRGAIVGNAPAPCPSPLGGVDAIPNSVYELHFRDFSIARPDAK